MSSLSTPSARDGALAKLAAEAARFATEPGADTPSRIERVPAPFLRPAPARPALHATTAPELRPGEPAGYVPVAVAPERGNTRPVVPVDGRLHMRMAQPTVNALDQIVVRWKAGDPSGLRDLERATLVRIAVAMLLSDVAQNASGGAVGEAVRAALDPAIRHTDSPMPDLSRWLRSSPREPQALSGSPPPADRRAAAVFD